MPEKQQFERNAEFVNYTLTKADGARIKAWADKTWPERDWVSVVVSQGYKITVSFDKRNRCYAAWLIATKDAVDNQGLILSGRGGSWLNAVIEVVWKHVSLFKGQWPRPTDDGESWTWDK